MPAVRAAAIFKRGEMVALNGRVTGIGNVCNARWTFSQISGSRSTGRISHRKDHHPVYRSGLSGLLFPFG